MKFKARRELKRTKIEIIPMIDTMFFLLVFFMLSSLALTRMNSLRVNLPQASTTAPEPTSKVMLTITKEQKLFLNQKEVTVENLQSRLRDDLKALDVDAESTSFIINADESVPHGLVVRTIDISKLAGIAHFAIATAPKRVAQ